MRQAVAGVRLSLVEKSPVKLCDNDASRNNCHPAYCVASQQFGMGASHVVYFEFTDGISSRHAW